MKREEKNKFISHLKNIKLKTFLLFFDILLILSIISASVIIYITLNYIMINEEEKNYKHTLQKTENFIKLQIENNIKNVELITKYLSEGNISFFDEIDFIESSYFIDTDFKIKKIFFPNDTSIFIEKMDLTKSQLVTFIKSKNLKENGSVVAPLTLSIITGKQAMSIITKVKQGFFINEIKIKKVFDFFAYTDLYQDSVILILENNSSNIIARSNVEKYPYYEFKRDSKNSITLNYEKYGYYISKFPLLNVDIVILTPKSFYARYFNLARGFFIIIIVLILFFVIFKEVIFQKYNYEPIKKFLSSINKDPLKPVNLGDNFKEWKSLEYSYNENIKKINEADKKIRQQYEEIQLQYEELEATYEELTNTNEELAQSNQNLIELNNRLIESENNLKVSLKEKEILLKEVHHRVKNNLQLISSVLNIQLNYLTDKKEINFLSNIRNRIKTISLIHEDIYGKENLSEIDFSIYINKLISYLAQNNNYNKKIEFDINIENIFFDLTKAIPLGLIINELIINAVSHAFDNGMDGKIFIEFFKKDGKFILIVKDNGKGIKDINYENSPGFGLKLVNLLIGQFNGVMEIEKDNGTIIKIHFEI